MNGEFLIATLAFNAIKVYSLIEKVKSNKGSMKFLLIAGVHF